MFYGAHRKKFGVHRIVHVVVTGNDIVAARGREGRLYVRIWIVGAKPVHGDAKNDRSTTGSNGTHVQGVRSQRYSARWWRVVVHQIVSGRVQTCFCPITRL